MASQECNVARGEDHSVVCVHLRHQNLEEVFPAVRSLGHSLLLHFSAVSLACSIGVHIAVVVAEVRLLCADLESAKEDLPN